MHKEIFDFNQISGQDDFFAQFSQRFALAANSIHDLEALWLAIVCRRIPLPLEIVFTNLTRVAQRRYGALILLMENAEEELEGQFEFNRG